MIIKVIIALAIYEASKFFLQILFVMYNSVKAKKEIEVQTKVKNFEEKLREKMEQNKESPTD